MGYYGGPDAISFHSELDLVPRSLALMPLNSGQNARVLKRPNFYHANMSGRLMGNYNAMLPSEGEFVQCISFHDAIW